MTTDFFGVYVHWPFCQSKCPYCDFNSHVADTIDHDKWAQAYGRELEYIAAQTPDRMVTSIFFGGGTPSLMEPDTVGRIISTVQRLWRVRNDIEITLEANPTSIEMEKFKAFQGAGVNRVSIGVQSLRSHDLDFLGRKHTVGEGIAALEIAHNVFERVSFDLIYARPEQSTQQWEEELNEALSHVPDGRGHISLYQLTIEKGTPFYTRHARGDFQIPPADQGGAFYETTQDIMCAHNMPAYEVSNHAHQGQESIHNLTYWRYGDYVGVGPGAHGRLTLNGVKYATRTHRAPDVWLKQVLNGGNGFHPFEKLSCNEKMTERLMMGLRLREGVALSYFDPDFINPQKIKTLCDEGMLQESKTHIVPTAAGLQRVNSILSYLL